MNNLTRKYLDGYLGDEETFAKIRNTFKDRDNETELRHRVRSPRSLRRNDDEVWEVEEQRLMAGTVPNV